MTENTNKPSDAVYFGIKSLRGWDGLLGDAEAMGGDHGVRIGRLVSGVLLAGGEDRVPVAITGALDDQGNGHLALLYPNVIVLVVTERFSANGGNATITMYALTAVEDVRITAGHNYYSEVAERGRHTRIEVGVRVADQTLIFPGKTYEKSLLTSDDAALAALTTFRQHLGDRG